MDPETFAARRRVQFSHVDDELEPSVKRALQKYANGEADWKDELIEDASVLWLETYKDEAPHADENPRMGRFQDSLSESLDKTEVPESPPSSVQEDRLARWLGTYVVNDATYNGAGARGVRNKRWTTMHDSAVRATHVQVDGQIRPIAAPFNVGGYELRFPGDPVGPPEIWINCRCLIQPAARTGEANVTPTTFAIRDEDVDTEPIEEQPDEELPVDEPEDDEEIITEVPVHGVLAPEGVPTGDGRQFAKGGMTHRDLPLPIAYQVMSAEGHANSVTVGRIDTIERVGDEMQFTGVIIATRQYAPEVIEGIVDGTVRGVSVDVDNIVLSETAQGMENELDFMEFSEARIAGVTIVPIPAFQEAFIGLGHEFASELTPEDEAALAACGCASGPDDDDDENRGYDAYSGEVESGIISLDDVEVDPIYASAFKEEALVFAPGTHDGPGWITHPIPTQRLRNYWTHGKGAAKIKWGVGGDFNRCRRQLSKYVKNPDWLAGMCANMHKEALGFWPSTHKKLLKHALVADGAPAPMFTLVAGAAHYLDSAFFQRQELEDPRIGIKVDGDHVYGYMAQWGVCHIGIAGICTEAPHSNTDYWYYATGVVDTNDGEVRVGQITMDTGHASLKASAKVAAAHYDNTGAAVADVVVGEDEFGIWFSGCLREGITDAQRHALRASGRISGDWREIRGNLEMVAGLVVNVPGLPIPQPDFAAQNGKQLSLVAAGVIDGPDPESALTASVTVGLDADSVAGIVRAAVAEYKHMEKRGERLTPLRASLREKQVAALRTKIEGKK